MSGVRLNRTRGPFKRSFAHGLETIGKDTRVRGWDGAVHWLILAEWANNGGLSGVTH